MFGVNRLLSRRIEQSGRGVLPEARVSRERIEPEARAGYYCVAEWLLETVDGRLQRGGSNDWMVTNVINKNGAQLIASTL